MEQELRELGELIIRHMANEYRDPDNKDNQYEILDGLPNATCRLAVILAAGELDNAWDAALDGIAECITVY